MLTEIDTRHIPGHGGTVTLFADFEFPANVYQEAISGPYRVVVSSREGETICTLDGLSRHEARNAYQHTFAYREVPDIFSRAV